jgi:GNAT superfamily N-acetyltransferase
MNSKNTLAAKRARLQRARFLSLTEPRDALTAYYALYHDPGRTQLWLHEDDAGRLDGLVAVCQTGFNLFQPTVVLRAPGFDAVAALGHQALQPGRPYYIVTTPCLRPAVQAIMRLEQEEQNRVYRFDPSRYRPEINVLVQPLRTPDGSPKFVIRSQDQIAAEAGINWRSPNFAELFVHVQPHARGRGWGKAVLSALTITLIQSGVQPLYMVSEGNSASLRLAQSLGFLDTGAREFAAAGAYVELT